MITYQNVSVTAYMTPPWIDKELLDLLKKKNVQRRKWKKSRNQKVVEKYKSLRRQSKILLARKKKEYGNTLNDSVLQNPKRFCRM